MSRTGRRLRPRGESATTGAPNGEDVTVHLDFLQTVNRELVESGELVDDQALTGPELAKRVTSDGTAPAVTDGPSPEVEELLAGDSDPDPGIDAPPGGDRDDTLTLLFMCCHPALTPPSAVALTLRAVGGLTTAEIAGRSWSPRRRWRSGSAGPRSGSRRPASRSACPPARRGPSRLAGNHRLDAVRAHLLDRLGDAEGAAACYRAAAERTTSLPESCYLTPGPPTPPGGPDRPWRLDRPCRRLTARAAEAARRA